MSVKKDTPWSWEALKARWGGKSPKFWSDMFKFMAVVATLGTAYQTYAGIAGVEIAILNRISAQMMGIGAAGAILSKLTTTDPPTD